MNTEKKMILFHNMNAATFHFYNIEEDKYLSFCKEKNKNNNEILWP